MPIIQNPSVGLRLKKFLGLTHLPDAVLAPEVVATVLVEDLSGGTLLRKCMGGVNEGGTPGNISLVALRNTPALGSPRDVQVRVTRAIITAADSTQRVDVHITGAPLGALTAGVKGFADNDLEGFPASEVGSTTPAAPPASRLLVPLDLTVSVPFVLDLDYLLGALGIARDFQNSIFVASSSLDTRLKVAWFWEESNPEPQ